MNEIDAIDLAELFGFDEALAYINSRLMEARRLSVPGFKRHIYDAEPGLFQLEPIRIGWREYDGGEGKQGKAYTLVFTRRMLDEYVTNRETNARRRGARVVTRPTESERAALLGRAEARAWLNDWFIARRLPFRISSSSMNAYRALGRIPHRVIGNSAVYRTRDVEAFAHDFTRRWKGRLRPADGRPGARQPKGRRTPRAGE